MVALADILPSIQLTVLLICIFLLFQMTVNSPLKISTKMVELKLLFPLFMSTTQKSSSSNDSSIFCFKATTGGTGLAEIIESEGPQ